MAANNYQVDLARDIDLVKTCINVIHNTDLDASPTDDPAAISTVLNFGDKLVAGVKVDGYDIFGHLSAIRGFKQGGSITLASDVFLTAPAKFNAALVTIGTHLVNDLQVVSNVPVGVNVALTNLNGTTHITDYSSVPALSARPAFRITKAPLQVGNVVSIAWMPAYEVQSINPLRLHFLQNLVTPEVPYQAPATIDAPKAVKFGRLKKNAVLIPKESLCSGEHGVFHPDSIEDSGSTHGTYVLLASKSQVESGEASDSHEIQAGTSFKIAGVILALA